MTVFYRKYRPQKFSDLVGQEQIVDTLLAQLESGKISHGYLFAGPRGTGKTSTARIFAKAVNCKNYQSGDTKNQKQKFGEPCGKCVSCLSIADGSALDLIEIDAASNRGIEEIRDLREKIKLSPVSSRFKVYIIDEAHMLTNEAFNALLKTLEEPPAHAIFILCTTAASKLPETIISRLSRIYFSRAKAENIEKALAKIAKSEGVDASAEVFEGIAKIADGSYRDAISIFDQLASSGKKITVVDVSKLGGAVGWESLTSFSKIIASSDLKEGVIFVEKLADSGVDISQFIRDGVEFFEKLLVLASGVEISSLFDLDKKQADDLEKMSSDFGFLQLQNIMKMLLVAESEIKIYPLPKIPLLLAVCKLCGQSGEQQSRSVVSETVKGNPARVADEPVKKVVKDNQPPRVLNVAHVVNSKGNVKSLAEVEAQWSKFVDKVKQINVHLSALLKSTRPVDISGDIVIVEVFYKFHKDKLEEPKVTKVMEGFLEELLGAKVGLRFSLANRKQELPISVKKSDVVDVAAGDLSKIAAEIFSK